MASKPLDQYQAAALIGFSPELLKYLTTHKVKWKESRKLVTAKEVDGTLFFDEAELKSYDAWLRDSWPAKDDGRASIPEGIKKEIKTEANLECALCQKAGEAGEAAHINPWKTSKNNHPHNLIWLCANHHTKFDKGYFGPKGATNEFILILKTTLQHFKRSIWSGQAEISKRIAATLSLCDSLDKQYEIATSEDEKNAVRRNAKKLLILIPELALKSSLTNVQPILTRLGKELNAGAASNGGATRKQLKTAASYEQEFLVESGLVKCPLCKGKKSHNGYDCPVCAGDGSVDKNLEVNLSEFEDVDCKLCSATGMHNDDDCPVCHGDKVLERRYSEQIDFDQYKLVKCPLCKGKGIWEGDDCITCRGVGKMERRAAENINLSDFEEVDCPLCEAEGVFNGGDCPECHGHQRMRKQLADNVDVTKYEDQSCPVCDGTGYQYNNDCRACGGHGTMSVGQVNELDVSLYKFVKCPECRGKPTNSDYDCRVCGGEGEIMRIDAERN